MLGDAGEPYDKQIEILDAVIGSRRVTVVGCNGSRKKGLPSPDKADALALAFMGSRETLGVWV